MAEDYHRAVLFGSFVAIGLASYIIFRFKISNDRIPILEEAVKKISVAKEKIKTGLRIEETLDHYWNRVKDTFLSKGIQEALDIVTKIIEKLKDFDGGGELAGRYKAPILILLGLIKRAQESFLTAETSFPEASEIDEIDYLEGKRLGHFALNVYEASLSSTKDTVLCLLGLSDENDLIYTSWLDSVEGASDDEDDDDYPHPKYVIFLDRDSKSVILAIRGTFSFTDIITDIVCEEEKFQEGFAHKGILRGARRILSKSRKTLESAFEHHPEMKRLVVTGHSLGAGTAELITLELEKIGFDKEIKCIALAPPPVFRSNVPLTSPPIDSIHIFINDNDIVPRLSLASLAQLLATLRKVDDLPLTVEEHFKVLNGKDDESLRKIEKAVSSVSQEKFPYLHHPGKIHYLRKRGKRKFLTFKQDASDFFRNILLSENMILDHLQPYYEAAFAASGV